MEPTTQSPNTKPDSGVGAIVGSIIVVLIIILGAFYLYTEVQERRNGADDTRVTQVQNNEPTTTAELEAELQSIDTDNLDAEMNDIEAEF